MEDAGDGLLDGIGDPRHVLRAEQIHAGKGDGEVEGGHGKVDAQRVPPIGTDEMLEALREGAIAVRWSSLSVLRGRSLVEAGGGAVEGPYAGAESTSECACCCGQQWASEARGKGPCERYSCQEMKHGFLSFF